MQRIIQLYINLGALTVGHRVLASYKDIHVTKCHQQMLPGLLTFRPVPKICNFLSTASHAKQSLQYACRLGV